MPTKASKIEKRLESETDPEKLYGLINKQSTREGRSKCGPLTYIYQDKPKSKIVYKGKGLVVSQKEKQSNKKVALLLPIVVSVFLSAVMLIQFAPTKNSIVGLNNQVQTQIESLGTSINRLEERINNFKPEDVSSDQLSTIQSKIDELEQRLAKGGF